ncbi:MAG TPA: MucR family transcriptional regulator [Desulfuromonadales bacterium]|nr:MucR family transcriptional regulator [Desulfuromonadales bacterium]
MATLLEMATDIVSSHATTTPMSKDELIAEINSVYSALNSLDKGEAVTSGEQEKDQTEPAISKRKAFGKSKIYCMICGKGFTTLKRHLSSAHEMTPREYRDQFDIPSSQPLAAKNYSEQRKQMAIDRGLGEKLAAARKQRNAAKKK